METEIINNFAAVRLLINIYMVKRLKSSFKPVNQEKFIEEVGAQFHLKKFNYSTKSILFTWKYLLDNYQHYKQNFTAENANKVWKYFSLMDNCFDNIVATSEKFSDHKWTLHLLESLSKYRSTVLKQGITMDILQAVEDDFQSLGNYNINQKDIYNHWLLLKKIYKKYLNNNCKVDKYYSYYSALKDFFEKDIGVEQNVTDANVTQNELNSAIKSIMPMEEPRKIKRRKTDNVDLENIVMANKTVADKYTPFTVVMHDILLQCCKKNKTKIRDLSGQIDNDTLNMALEEFNKLGYNVTKSSIYNEWNDLSCRFELIKNTEQPQKWPYFEDINYIYNSEDLDDDINNTEAIANYDDAENVRNLLKNSQKVTDNEVEIGEKLLNIYECNNKEFLEIKDTLVERNLLKEETNYLLNIFVEKFNKRRC